MDAITFLSLALRLGIWFLLTADLSLPNILIGISIALLLPLPRSFPSPGAFREWMQVLWETIIVIPQAFVEAIQIMLLPHNHEKMVMEKIKPKRTPGLIFLDIFLITFTPKTIVAKYHEEGWYEVHYVTWRKETTESKNDIKPTKINTMANGHIRRKKQGKNTKTLGI